MQVWNMLHAARWKYRTQNDAKNRHLRTIAQLHPAISSQLRHASTIGKNVKQQYLPTCPYNMVNFGLPAAEIISLVWGTTANFNGFRVLASLLQPHRSPEANQTLHDVWLSTWLLHYIYTFGGSCPWRNFATWKIHSTLRPSLVFSYIGSLTARHSNSGH